MPSSREYVLLRCNICALHCEIESANKSLAISWSFIAVAFNIACSFLLIASVDAFVAARQL